jgi:hypothetical protein
MDEDDNTIDMSIIKDYDTITIDSSSMTDYSSYTYGAMPTVTISTGATGSSVGVLTSSGLNGTSWSNTNWSIGSGNTNPSSLNVKGDAEFEGDVKIKGVSIAKTLEEITKRLAILVPDPEKLEHFEALKKAYQHYKTLEALCEIPKEESKE